MLVIHLRTVAFFASVLTTVQSILWIIGYILYVVTYACGYSHYYYEGIGLYLPTDLGSYYLWYFQGFNCTAPLTWIGNVRTFSPQLLLSLISIGFVGNIILLSTSIYILVGFFSNSGSIGIRLQFFSYSVLSVSLWDLILVINVSIDFSPLMVVSNYIPHSNKTKGLEQIETPSFFAQPYFTEVFTVVIMLLSRMILFWILNVFFASYILAKQSNETSKPSPAFNSDKTANKSRPSSFRENTHLNEIAVNSQTWNDAKINLVQDKLSRQLPTIADDEMVEEVRRRWNFTAWDPSIKRTTPVEQIDEFMTAPNSVSPSNITNGLNFNEENWNEIKNRVRESRKRRRNEDAAVISNPSRNGTIQRVNIERNHFPPQSNLREIQNMPNLPSRSSSTSTEASSDHRRNRFIHNRTENPFNIKLRHIPRDPLNGERSPETVLQLDSSGDTSSEVNPYLVSSISDIDPNYEPTDLMQAQSVPFSSTRNENKVKINLKPPPPPPSVKSFSNTTVNDQISFEEAFRTRRPLRPVGSKIRPPIDTHC